MKFIAIDTSQEYLTVIACNNDKVHTVHINDCAIKHSLTLMPSIEQSLNKVELTASEVELIAVTVGAGSFTGIRIGISTAKGFASPGNIKTLGVTSFDTIAYAKGVGKCLAVVNAKHDNFYIAGYNDCRLIIPPRFVNIIELKAIKGYKLCSGVKINGLKTEIVDTSKGLYNAVLKNANNATVLDELHPLYLRLSQAEEGRL